MSPKAPKVSSSKVSGSGVFGDAVHIAEEIRQRIKFELGITVSIGITRFSLNWDLTIRNRTL